MRILVQGLLIAGVTPFAIVNSTVMSTEQKNQVVSGVQSQIDDSLVNSSCAGLTLPQNCLASTTTVAKLEIHSDLWLRRIANSLLSDSFFLACGQQSLKRSKSDHKLLSQEQNYAVQSANSFPFMFHIAQFPKIDDSLSSLGKLATQKCNFSWQKKLDQESINLESLKLDKLASRYHHSQNYYSQPKFPPLSRSSLIVSFPQENSSFVPINTKLANPAPETKRIASPFGWRKRPYSNQLQFHQGIDYGAPYGSPVVAVGSGIVTKVVSGCADFGNLFCGGQLGNWIEIDHGNGAIGTYGHLKSSSITVTEGMTVWKNQNIAQVGSSGWSTGAHLDFRLKINGKHEDPTKYVMAMEPEKVNLAKQ